MQGTLGTIVPVHFQTLSAQWLASWRAQIPRCAGYAAPRQHSDSVIRWHGMAWECKAMEVFVKRGRIRLRVRKKMVTACNGETKLSNKRGQMAKEKGYNKEQI